MDNHLRLVERSNLMSLLEEPMIGNFKPASFGFYDGATEQLLNLRSRW